MKKISYVLLVGLFTFGFVPQILAQEEPSVIEEETVQTQNTNLNEEIETTRETVNGNDVERRLERLENYKARVEARLDFAEERRIQARCKGAQTVSLRLAENITRVKQNREKAYQSVVEKLNSLVDKLEAAGVNSSSLDSAVQSLDGEIAVFISTLGDYETILSDLTELDCEEDPTAFKAALEVAKQQRVLLVSSSQSLRQYFNDTIKPELVEIRQSLISEGEGEE